MHLAHWTGLFDNPDAYTLTSVLLPMEMSTAAHCDSRPL